ncbi:MAG: hypothetical protein GYB65_16345 [Chloroflexi bacterium]|nr:hypothetical protein [Chloroflexota bacterium]
MKIEFLGTASAISIPRAGCACPVCTEARAKGLPYSRSGPGLFIHDLGLLIDTSEDINMQLNRAGIMHIDACLYSHWHPDHVLGYRVWEMNADLHHPGSTRPTDVYVPQQVAVDLRQFLGAWDQLTYAEQRGLVRLHELADGDTITLKDTRITPFRLAEDYVYAFLFEQGDRRVLIAPDELHNWAPPPEVHGVDLAILPIGVVEFHPLSGARQIPEDHYILQYEATLAQTLDMVRTMQPQHAILTHIDEPSRLGYDDYIRLEVKLQAEGLNIQFAYDTLQVEV